MLLGSETIAFLAPAIASRRRKLSGGVKPPHLTQFHAIVTSPPMLQLGDKGARQSKRILVKHKLRLRSMAVSVLGRSFGQFKQGPKPYLDALTRMDARFL